MVLDSFGGQGQFFDLFRTGIRGHYEFIAFLPIHLDHQSDFFFDEYFFLDFRPGLVGEALLVPQGGP